MIVVRHREGRKEVLLVDVVESGQQIQAEREKEVMINTLREEDHKPEGCIELTSKGLAELSVLDVLHNPQRIRVVNLG